MLLRIGQEFYVNISDLPNKSVISTFLCQDFECIENTAAENILFEVKFCEKIQTNDLKNMGCFEYDDTSFYLSDRDKNLISLPFDKLDSPFTLDVELLFNPRDFLYILKNIIAIRLLSYDYALVHASSFSDNSKAVMIGAWSGVGKTIQLLEFAKHGYPFISDDLTPISRKGFAETLIKSVKVYEKEMIKNPSLIDGLPAKSVRPIRNLIWLLKFGSLLPGKIRLLYEYAVRSISMIISKNARIFLKYGIESDNTVIIKGHRHTIKNCFILSNIHSRIKSDKIGHKAAATSLLNSFIYEQALFFSYYNAFRYVFPERECKLIDDYSTISESIISSSLRKCKCYSIGFPEWEKPDKIYKIIKGLIK